VHAHLEEEYQDDFLVGMFIRADILMNKEADGASLRAVPEEAVAVVDSQSYILLLESDSEQGYVFRMVPVNPGPSAEGFTSIEIAPDIPADAQILIRGVFGLVGGP
jgi:cobalt-zinc-cadmium efflux system membrane fusion protein